MPCDDSSSCHNSTPQTVRLNYPFELSSQLLLCSETHVNDNQLDHGLRQALCLIVSTVRRAHCQSASQNVDMLSSVLLFTRLCPMLSPIGRHELQTCSGNTQANGPLSTALSAVASLILSIVYSSFSYFFSNIVFSSFSSHHCFLSSIFHLQH